MYPEVIERIERDIADMEDNLEEARETEDGYYIMSIQARIEYAEELLQAIKSGKLHE